MKTLLIIFALLIWNLAAAQQKFSREEMIEDISFFGRLLINNDPISTVEEKKASRLYFEKKLTTFDKNDLSTGEFIRYLRELKSIAKYDSHAGISFTDTVPPTNLFPLPVIVMDRKLFVNIENDSIPFGSIIHSINGIGTSEILYKLTGGDTTSTLKLGKLVNEFFYLYYLILGPSEQFIIEYSLKSENKIKKTTVRGIDIFKYLEVDTQKTFPLHRDFFYTQYYPETDTYYLQLNSFSWPSIKDSNQSIQTFQHLFDSLFTDIKRKQAKNVIIDLKNNLGGEMSIAILLFSYFIDSSMSVAGTFKLPADVTLSNLVSINKIPVENDSSAIAILNKYKQHTVTEGQHDKGTFEQSLSPNLNKFNGNLYVLISGRTFSAAVDFTALIKAYNKAVLVGEKVGSSIYNSTAGLILQYQLPNTKLIIETPIVSLNFSDQITSKLPEKYISPDIKLSFESRYKYFLEKKDADLEETLLLIQQKHLKEKN